MRGGVQTMNKNAGFTLIELLVVVLIVGILAAVAVPQYELSVEKARAVRAMPLLRNIFLAQDRSEMATGTRSGNDEDWDITIPYTVKTEFSPGHFRYKVSDMGVFTIYETGTIIFSGKGYTIDYYGRPKSEALSGGAIAICYPYQTGTLGERVCRSLGRKLERVSGAGTPCYAVDY